MAPIGSFFNFAGPDALIILAIIGIPAAILICFVTRSAGGAKRERKPGPPPLPKRPE